MRTDQYQKREINRIIIHFKAKTKRFIVYFTDKPYIWCGRQELNLSL